MTDGTEVSRDPADIPATTAEEPIEILVVAVDDDRSEAVASDAPPADIDVLNEAQVAALAAEHRGELDAALADLQQQLATAAATGDPRIDDALAALATLDPTDLSTAGDTLAELLATLEGVLREQPRG